MQPLFARLLRLFFLPASGLFCRRVLAGLSFMACVGALAQSRDFEATVLSVTSGDSLLVADSSGQRHNLRLLGIAAPALSQPYHANARDFMTAQVKGKPLRVQTLRTQSNGQVVARVYSSAPDCTSACPLGQDLGLKLLEAGLAWWLKAERKEQSLSEQGYYEYAEFDARQRRIGLWLDAKPVPPWQWKPKGPGLV